MAWTTRRGTVERTDALMASYRRGDARLSFYLSTGTVASFIDHPTQSKSQLFRREINQDGATALLDNLWQHTGVGYHTRDERAERKRPQLPPAGKTRSARPMPVKVVAHACRCGEAKPNKCAQACCRRCCPGPCERHRR